MSNRFNIDKKYISLLLISITVILILTINCLDYYSKMNNFDNNLTDISHLKIESNNKVIHLKWDNPKIEKNSFIQLKIESENSPPIITNLNRFTTEYKFYDGNHGEKYTFSVKIKNSLGNISKGVIEESMFLDFDQMSGLPIMNITTNGELPTSDIVYPPEGYWGISITNNNYVSGNMSIDYLDGHKIQTTMEFKIRGNTSAYNARKKPYKLELENKLDLILSNEGNSKSKDWVLLPSGTDFSTMIGQYISYLCDVDWQPNFEFVNLLINGDYKGCYLLIESVEKGKEKLNITDNGFIIENDPYWWNGEVNYFRTVNQYGPFSYTFKYPKEKNITSEDVRLVYEYMQYTENLLYSHDKEYLNFIDIDSFSSWVLAQDILGNIDYAGSNMFLYKNSLTDNSLLQIGPLWDLGAAFSVNDSWSPIHTNEAFYFIELFKDEEFVNCYKTKWLNMSTTIYESIDQYFKEVLENNGEAIQISWDLDAKRWNKVHLSVDEQYQNITTYLRNRINWINEEINKI